MKQKLYLFFNAPILTILLSIMDLNIIEEELGSVVIGMLPDFHVVNRDVLKMLRG